LLAAASHFLAWILVQFAKQVITMEYTEIFGSPRKVDSELAMLMAEGWKPVIKSAASWDFAGVMQQRPPKLVTVLLQRTRG
jgi:hypothetical protein